MAKQKGHGTDEMDIAAEFIQHEQMKETQDYVARGRRFSHIAGPQLAEQWVVAFKRRFSDRPIKKLLVLDDLAAELRLRGSEPPYEAVQVETAEMRDEIIRMGPESLSDEATKRINRYLHLRKRPKN